MFFNRNTIRSARQIRLSDRFGFPVRKKCSNHVRRPCFHRESRAEMDPDGLADAGVPSDARPGSEDTDPTPGSAGLDGEGLDGEALGWEPACSVPGTGGP